GDRRREAVGDAGGDLADRHGRSVSLAGAGQVDGAGTVGAPGVEADGFEAGGDGVVVVDGVEVVDGELGLPFVVHLPYRQVDDRLEEELQEPSGRVGD